MKIYLISLMAGLYLWILITETDKIVATWANYRRVMRYNLLHLRGVMLGALIVNALFLITYVIMGVIAAITLAEVL